MSIKCTATGVPLPQITWSLDGFALDALDSSMRTGDYVTNENYVISFVNISSVKAEHGGSYACRAASDAGWIENAAAIRVLGDPVVRPMGNWSATAGSDVVIKCPVGGYPIEDIHWEKSECLSCATVCSFLQTISLIEGKRQQRGCLFLLVIPSFRSLSP